MAVQREKDLHKPTLRKITRLKDGALKNSDSIIAARLVAKGTYAYADGGPDESINIKKKRTISTMEHTPSDVISLSKIPELKVVGDGEQYTGPPITIRSDDSITTRGTTADFEPKANRKITRKADIPKEKMEFILKTNVANVMPAPTSKNSGSLKGIIDKVRSERK